MTEREHMGTDYNPASGKKWKRLTDLMVDNLPEAQEEFNPFVSDDPPKEKLKKPGAEERKRSAQLRRKRLQKEKAAEEAMKRKGETR
jgi:hypothetical protein